MTFRQTDFAMFYFKFSRFLKLEGGKIKYCHMFPRLSHFQIMTRNRLQFLRLTLTETSVYSLAIKLSRWQTRKYINRMINKWREINELSFNIVKRNTILFVNVQTCSNLNKEINKQICAFHEKQEHRNFE